MSVIPAKILTLIGRQWLNPFLTWLDGYLGNAAAGGILIKNGSGGTLAKGTAVAISSYDVATGAFIVIAADNTDPAKVAIGVLAAAVLNNATATVQANYSLALSGLDTTGGAVGDPVYLGTAGALVLAAPAAGAAVQVVGRVATVAASGTLAILVRQPRPLADGGVTTAKLAAAAVTKAKALVFFSTQQTGTGSSQNIAHGLGATPAGVLIVAEDTTAAGIIAGGYSIAQGSHTSTNVVVTTTNALKYRVFAWA